VGCQLWFLPPYSPELNPIEQTWASLKRYVKRFRSNFDSLTLTLDYIFQSVPFFSRQDE
jgi:transposase